MKEAEASDVRLPGSPWASWGALLAMAALALAGCRTYGGYDSTEKMLPQMQQSVRSFGEDLQRARANRALLVEAAEGDSVLRAVAQEFGRAVQHHEQVLEENRAILDRFEEDLGSYRTMHRAYGAMLSEHEAARKRYRSLVRAVRYPGVTQTFEAPSGGRTGGQLRALPDTLPRTRAENFTEGRYYMAPIFYDQVQSANTELTMRQALTARSRRESRPGTSPRTNRSQGEEGFLPGTASPDTAATAPSAP